MVSKEDLKRVKAAYRNLADRGAESVGHKEALTIVREFIDSVEVTFLNLPVVAPMPPAAPFPKLNDNFADAERINAHVAEILGMQSALRLQCMFTCQSDKREASALYNYAGVKLELATLREQIASAISRGDLKETFYKDLPK